MQPFTISAGSAISPWSTTSWYQAAKSWDLGVIGLSAMCNSQYPRFRPAMYVAIMSDFPRPEGRGHVVRATTDEATSDFVSRTCLRLGRRLSLATGSQKHPPDQRTEAAAGATARRSHPGDNIDGEDLVVRRAAVDALGPVKGSVVVVDPDTGRILTIVNQKLAFEGGYMPCSTIKLVTSLAALTEHVVDPDTWIYTGRAVRYNLTTALAVSNNQYFATLGSRLGFDRVVKYAQLLGLGEKAGLNIAEEQPGTIAEAPPAAGGMGMMTAYG